MVWLYAGGVSFILPDVRFGTVSLDSVTNKRNIISTSHRITTLIKVFRLMVKYEVHYQMQTRVIECKFKNSYTAIILLYFKSDKNQVT